MPARTDSIPEELRELPQWVVWRFEVVNDRETKVPYQSGTPARKASTTDAATWSSYGAAVDTAAADGVDGIGFVFTKDDPYSGVDFDGCVDGEDINPHVGGFMRTLDSYTEFSPSGTGLHVIVRASVNGGPCRTPKTPWDDDFENYDRGRFFCVTGRHVLGTPRTVNDRQQQLDAVRSRIFPVKAEHKPPPAVTVAAGDDRELLARARGAANGTKFTDLYDAATHSYGSHSEADLALCDHLAFWTGTDPGRIDRLFRGSARMREKWDATRGESTYGAQTIEKALAGRTEFYGGSRGAVSAPERSRPSGGSGSTQASTIKPRRIRWAWKGRLALGYLSLWSGESSLGKSTYACALFAELTRGRLEGHLHGEPSKVLIVASEDAREDMWIPRLMVAGADLELVEFQDQTRDWNLRDGMGLTGHVLDQVGAKIVFVDSVLEHMPEPKSGESINSPTFIRRSLGPFADLCKARHVAGLVSTHPPKAKGTTFADNVIASAAFVHVTRVGLLFAWHPEDIDLPDQERRRILMRPPGGSNIGRDPGTFEFRVLTRDLEIEGETEEIPYTTPPAPSDVTYRDLTRTAKEDGPARTRVADAKAFIDVRLADGKWHPSMIEELTGLGYSKTTAYRAAEPCEKRKALDSDGTWWWAAHGTPKSTFVEVGGNMGPSRAPARSSSQPGTFPPKPPLKPYTDSSSHIPAELDESPQQQACDDRSSHVPTLGIPPRARARDASEDELQRRIREIAALPTEAEQDAAWKALEGAPCTPAPAERPEPGQRAPAREER
jgi:putative DNA primase/helicase